MILTAVVDCLPFEFFAVGTDGRYMLVNAVCREHYGDALGKLPEECAPDEATRRLWGGKQPPRRRPASSA